MPGPSIPQAGWFCGWRPASNFRLALARVLGLLIALDGKLAGKTHRASSHLIAIDLYGVCLVSWGCAGGAQSYLPLSG